jgi:hypothetical protein
MADCEPARPTIDLSSGAAVPPAHSGIYRETGEGQASTVEPQIAPNP